ncbi:hypothetical protein [uncultured Clostridium sp.]|uniref:hypothetical protein n=1 Tax=uncultured Clostridium sp. TaxID=59620 RepID=UPI0025E9C18C|nr:hypothetical protein [uncultured Clostridium sp.]
MNKFINGFLNILLIVFITLLLLNQLYVIEFSTDLKKIFIFLTFIMILFVATKEILTGKSNFLKFINIVTLCSIIIGGVLSVLNNQLNIFIYICILFSLFQCLFELIQNKA